LRVLLEYGRRELLEYARDVNMSVQSGFIQVSESGAAFFAKLSIYTMKMQPLMELKGF
jgi:hypothetical protein